MILINTYGRRNLHWLAEHTKERIWRQLVNGKGQTLKCSHYLPSIVPEDSALPCVVYCHGNSGCRADANEAAFVLLPANITVFTLDFAGSGLSDGNYVSLGWHEKDDLRVVVTYLKCKKNVSHIGFWGRSMGAVTSLLYGSEDPSISGMVLDSAFTNLFDLMMELVDVYKIRLPKFTVKMAMRFMRRGIQRRANFDIRKLNCMQVASRTCIPALFGHANEDKFIPPHHTDILYKLYAGDKKIIKFDGDHNSSRPEYYYDAVSMFFNNTLHPPQVPSVQSKNIEECHGLKDLRVSAGLNEMLLYEILSNLRIASSDATSSSSALPSLSTAKSVTDILYEIAPILGTNDNIDDSSVESCSRGSSNRESFGRCSSLGVSDFTEYVDSSNNHQRSPCMQSTTKQNVRKSVEDKEKDKMSPKQSKSRKSERFGGFRRLVRHYMLKRVKVGHQRPCS